MVASQEQVELLKRGVEVWNWWRKERRNVEIDLSGTDFSDIDLTGADFTRTKLQGADFTRTNLSFANFSDAVLIGTNFFYANLRDANFIRADLRESNLTRANLSGADLRQVDLREASLTGADLRSADISRADLVYANLSGADLRDADLWRCKLSHADFSFANLSNTLLSASELIESNLTSANLTGACIQDWNINRTQLDNVICEYVYWKYEWSNQERRYLLSDRRPSDPNRIFAPGEFTTLIRQALEIVDLIFVDGIDWQAFFQSFQELRSQYDDLSIQAIKKSGSAFVIRLEVPPGADKAAIEGHAKELYEMRLQLQEQRYRTELNAKEREIEIYKQQSVRMDKIVELLATREEPKVSLHANQLKILQAMKDEGNSHDIARVTGLSIDLVNYYIEGLGKEGYVRFSAVFSAESDSIQYLCDLTSQGTVAITNPDLLLPPKQAVASQTTIHAQTVGAIHSGSGNITNFTQNINSNIDGITKLLTSLRNTAQTFPEEQREEALEHLGDVEEGIRQFDKVKPHRIKAALAALLAIAGMVAATTDFSNNVLEIGDKLGIELVHTPSNQQLPPSK
ncbi:pentapeptide repeat-containing protein [Pseudanabaenaceae cyanobacterium LEGE 13415]|nr:pentapeptide repeat-containing protein [Pseudanabaenaceae cyanobacterium LEGE 13415]